VTGGRRDAKGPAERGQPVGHPLHTAAGRCSRLVEARAVIGDRERQALAVVAEGHAGRRGVCVLGDVLQRLQDTEVHRGLDVLRVPADARSLDRYRQRWFVGLRFERGRQAQVGEQRRVDPAGEITELFQRVLRRLLGPSEQPVRLVR
jgi:hypothetical protein